MEESFDFAFPTTMSHGSGSDAAALSNDIVFCGKVIARGTEEPDPSRKQINPLLVRSGLAYFKPNSGRTSSLNSDQCKRSDSLRSPSRSGSGRKRFNGLFGILKFPLHMELSEIKQRQGRRDPPRLPKMTLDEDGEVVVPSAGKSCWEIIRPMGRGNFLTSALAKLGCIPLV